MKILFISSIENIYYQAVIFYFYANVTELWPV